MELVLAWANLTQVVEPEYYITQLHISLEQEYPKAKALPGVEKSLSNPSTANSGMGGKIHVATALSSDKHCFDMKTGNLDDFFGVFEQERRVLGGETKIPKGRGKPFPDIYLLALKIMNDYVAEGEAVIKPEVWLLFEDAVTGIVAGRSASTLFGCLMLASLLCTEELLRKCSRGWEKVDVGGSSARWETV